MRFGFDRRSFLKSSAALSAMTPFSSFATAGTLSSTPNPGVSLYFLNDAVIMRQMSYPFPSQKLLSHGGSLGSGVAYAPDDLFCPLDNLNHDNLSYFLIATPQHDTFCYRIFEVDHSNFDEPRRNLVAELGPMEADQNGRAVLNAHTNLYLVTRIDEKLHIFLFDSKNFQMNIVAVEEDGSFMTLNSCALKMPNKYSFHMMPKEAFSGEENVFLLVNGTQKSQEFLQLDVSGAAGLEWKTLARLDHGSMLHGDWAYKFSSVVSLSQEMRGDQYFMMVQYDRNSPHAFLFLRADNRLAALTFQKNGDGFEPVVLGVSQKKYLGKETRIYAAYYDHTLQKDVVLCRNNETEKPFLLSLEKAGSGEYEFVEMPLDLTVDDEKAQGYLNTFFTSQSGAMNSFLLSSHHNTEGVPLQLVLVGDDEENKEHFHINFHKNCDGFATTVHPIPVTLKSDFVDKEVDDTVSFFTGIHNWAKDKDYLPYNVLGIVLAAGLFAGLVMRVKGNAAATKTCGPVIPLTDSDEWVHVGQPEMTDGADGQGGPSVVGQRTPEGCTQAVEGAYCQMKSMLSSDTIGYSDRDPTELQQFVEASLSSKLGPSVFQPKSLALEQAPHELRPQIVNTIVELMNFDKELKLYVPVENESIEEAMQNLNGGKVSLGLLNCYEMARATQGSSNRSSILNGVLSFTEGRVNIQPAYSPREALMALILDGVHTNYSSVHLTPAMTQVKAGLLTQCGRGFNLVWDNLKTKCLAEDNLMGLRVTAMGNLPKLDRLEECQFLSDAFKGDIFPRLPQAVHDTIVGFFNGW